MYNGNDNNTIISFIALPPVQVFFSEIDTKISKCAA